MENLRYLYANLLKNDYGNVEVFPLGLSNEPGLRNIYGFGAVASFVKNWSASGPPGRRLRRYQRWTSCSLANSAASAC